MRSLCCKPQVQCRVRPDQIDIATRRGVPEAGIYVHVNRNTARGICSSMAPSDASHEDVSEEADVQVEVLRDSSAGPVARLPNQEAIPKSSRPRMLIPICLDESHDNGSVTKPDGLPSVFRFQPGSCQNDFTERAPKE